jgi:purine-binding chemotaxis protein CheW
VSEDTQQMIIFDIGTEKFGIKITRIHEIIRMKEITELPDSSEYFAGIVNRRGDIVSVVDLRKRFGLTEIVETDNTRIIIIDFEGKDVGLVVDGVSEVLHIDETNIDDPPQSMVGIKDDYLEGIVKVNDDIVIILELDNLLDSREEIELDKEVQPNE